MKILCWKDILTFVHDRNCAAFAIGSFLPLEFHFNYCHRRIRKRLNEPLTIYEIEFNSNNLMATNLHDCIIERPWNARKVKICAGSVIRRPNKRSFKFYSGYWRGKQMIWCHLFLHYITYALYVWFIFIYSVWTLKWWYLVHITTCGISVAEIPPTTLF